MEEETYDISKNATTKNIVRMIQVGNFIECTTETGQVFNHAIPVGKMLNKNEKGEWILEDLILRG